MIILSDDVDNTDVPIVNTFIIVFNVMVFVWMFYNVNSLGSFYMQWGTVPERFVALHDFEQFEILVASTFIHSGFVHLIGNMWVLYLFGDNVEDRLGHFTYLLFYLACGLFAGLIHIASEPGSAIPAIGASGAIAGVMGAYMAMHPSASCKTWMGDDAFFLAFRTVKIPAVLIIGGWFFLQVFFCAISSAEVMGIALYAHIGGFLAGLGLLSFIRWRDHDDRLLEELPGSAGALSILSVIALVVMFWLMLRPTGSLHAADSQEVVSTGSSQQAHETKPTTVAAKKSKETRTTVHKRANPIPKHNPKHNLNTSPSKNGKHHKR